MRIARGCRFATLSIYYYDLGRTTGEMDVTILTGKNYISANSTTLELRLLEMVIAVSCVCV